MGFLLDFPCLNNLTDHYAFVKQENSRMSGMADSFNYVPEIPVESARYALFRDR